MAVRGTTRLAASLTKDSLEKHYRHFKTTAAGEISPLEDYCAGYKLVPCQALCESRLLAPRGRGGWFHAIMAME